MVWPSSHVSPQPRCRETGRSLLGRRHPQTVARGPFRHAQVQTIFNESLSLTCCSCGVGGHHALAVRLLQLHYQDACPTEQPSIPSDQTYDPTLQIGASASRTSSSMVSTGPTVRPRLVQWLLLWQPLVISYTRTPGPVAAAAHVFMPQWVEGAVSLSTPP
jgi:hypothetical protein